MDITQKQPHALHRMDLTIVRALNAIPCSIYGRKSSAKGLDERFNSIDAQTELGMQWIERDPNLYLVDVYADGGKSGYSVNRKDFQRMLTDARAGKFRRLIVYKMDRLSRNLRDFVLLREELEKLGIEVVVLADPFEDKTPSGRLLRTMQMVNAEHERTTLIQRVRDKLSLMRSRGMWTGGPAPYGYDVVDKQLVLNESEATIVREIFTHYLECQSATKVADNLRRKGYATKQRKRKGGDHGAPQWTKNMALTILRNPIYAGLIPDGDKRYPGEHKAIVTLEIFDQVGVTLQDLTIDGDSHGANPNYYLRGLIRCESNSIDGTPCGHTFTPASTRKRVGKERIEYRYYRCVGVEKKGASTCHSCALPADAIETFVSSHIRHASTDPVFMGKLGEHVAECARYRDRLAAKRSELSDQVADLYPGAERMADALLAADGESKGIYQGRVNAIARRIADGEKQIKALSESIASLDALRTEATWMLDQLSHLDEHWDQYTPDNRARVVRSIVTEIKVNEYGKSVAIVVSPLGRRMSALQERSLADAGNADASQDTPPDPIRVEIQGTLRRIRQRAVSFALPQTEPTRARKPATIALTVALAHHTDRSIRAGRFEDRNAAARMLGISKPRMTQVMLLLMLAPDLQERLLFLQQTAQGSDPVTEAAIRPLAMTRSWAAQRALWDRDIAPMLAPSEGSPA